MTKCVGCGRCIRVCPVDIDITEIAAELREQGQQAEGL
jgi:ferredoxin